MYLLTHIFIYLLLFINLIDLIYVFKWKYNNEYDTCIPSLIMLSNYEEINLHLMYHLYFCKEKTSTAHILVLT